MAWRNQNQQARVSWGEEAIMSKDIVRLVKGKPTIGDRAIEVRKKGLVYLLIDLSDSMNYFVGPKAAL
jgi:uncharacterized protein with von Willebrand factor type A (vWA) domain